MALYFNNPTPERVANPLQSMIDEAGQTIASLRDASQRLQQAVAEERDAYGRLKDMQEMYDGAEAELIAEAAVEAAAAKTGPLGGIPVSSEGYKHAMTALKTKLRTGFLDDMWADLDVRRLQYEQASIARTQAETEFSTMRKIAELSAAMLKAAAL